MPSVNVPNYGLLTGLANGLREGLTSYQTTKNIQHQQNMQEMLNGLQKDEDGNLVYTPEKQAQMQAGLLENQAKAASYSGESEASKRQAVVRGGLLHAANAKIATDLYKGVPAYEQEKLDPLSKSEVSGNLGLQGKQAVADAMGQRAEVQRGNQAVHAGESFDKDSLIKQMTGTKNNLDRAQQMLDGKTPITSSNFAILQQDMINAMAPGGAATEGKVNREMVNTFASKLNELQTKFGQVKDLRKEQPEIFNQLRSLIIGVRGDYAKAAKQRVKEIGSNFQDVNNSGVQNTVARKQGLLNEKFSADENQALQPPATGGGHPEDSAAVQWAKANPNDPRSAAILKANGL